MEYTDWAALVAALAAVVVALPAIPKSSGRRYWMSGGIALLVVAAGLGVIAAGKPGHNPGPEPSSSPPPAGSSAGPSPSGPPVGPSPADRGVSKAAFLAQAEKLCADHQPFTQTMPDRGSDPAGFGRWLRRITAGNQAVLDAIARVGRPRADGDVLTDLFAQRQHANDLFLRSARAFEAGQSRTGEQFLNSAIGVEAAYREAARTYGFSICIGADDPGR